MYGCKSWMIKKAEHWRTDTFELWHWRRLLRVPWTARRSNQSILKEISPEYSLERLMLKLKLQYFGHLMWRIDSLGTTLMLGKIEGKRKRGWQNEMVGWHHWLNGHEFEQALGVGGGQGSLMYCSPWGCKESDMTEQLSTAQHSQSYGFFNSHVWMWELDHKETWVWVSSRSWWWTGKPGVLQSMGSQRAGHDWVTELNWTESKIFLLFTRLAKTEMCNNFQLWQVYRESGTLRHCH